MNKKTRNLIIAGAGAVILLGGGGYAVMSNYMGNNVEIESVIPAASPSATTNANNSESNTSASGNNTSGNSGATEGTGALTSADLNGEWSIADTSKVYFSVTTSKETVNFENNAVSGNWTIDLDNQANMKGTGSIDLSVIDSGNSQRDGHIQSPDYFDISAYPTADFEATSFEGLPAEWTEGTVYDFTMTGNLNLRGIDKEVVFTAKALSQDGQVMLSGTTTVTFEDFGMANPHSVVLSTENDVAVQLELVLQK
ncbi:YceI family protein [Paenibacillus sp. CAU 1782]